MLPPMYNGIHLVDNTRLAALKIFISTRRMLNLNVTNLRDSKMRCELSLPAYKWSY